MLPAHEPAELDQLGGLLQPASFAQHWPACQQLVSASGLCQLAMIASTSWASWLVAQLAAEAGLLLLISLAWQQQLRSCLPGSIAPSSVGHFPFCQPRGQEPALNASAGEAGIAA